MPGGVYVRVLFLVLLLANLLFLAWTRWVVQPSTAARAAVAAGSSMPLRPIRLQQEVQGTSGDVAAADSASLDGNVTAATCVSVGPFREPTEAAAAEESLRRLGFSVRPRTATDEVGLGYWVRVPNLATPDDASNALAALRAAGFGDAYVVQDEFGGSAVSIGVFTTADGAAAAAATATRAGIATDTSNPLRTLDVHWLDVDQAGNGGLPDLDDLGSPVEGSLPLELRACPLDGGRNAPSANAGTPDDGQG